MIKKEQIISLVVLVAIVLVLGAVAGVAKTRNQDFKDNGGKSMPPISQDLPPPGGTTNPPKAGEVTLVGTGLCLPHRDTTGPQTLECAMGFQDLNGNNYGLSDIDPAYKNITAIGQVGRFRIHGVFVPRADEKYNSIGVVTVDTVTAL